MKEISYDPDVLIRISDSNRVNGLPACYEEMESVPMFIPSIILQLHREINSLSKRQKQVIKLFLAGKSDLEISQALSIKQPTVSITRQNAINKLKFKLLRQ